ncbi:MAG: nucleotidyl transferase AbiEii/AbiGii toxin family protein [Patescibacteria group bacterium]|nr:nucleotidyl transferase AbiEii/AbiGii toxin family protein [Patescibacteria group bacterium]
MLASDQRQALHKSVLLRVLIKILDNNFLAQNLIFKGDTCASMLGYLDRFSVDLDFTLKGKEIRSQVRQELEEIFKQLNLEIKDQSQKTIQYFLKYEASPQSRNTLKIDAVDIPFDNDQHEKKLLPDINRFAICQTKETMFAHKLVALYDRYQRNGSIAGRDLYDIHYYLQLGFKINTAVIEERTGKQANDYLQTLLSFIKNQINQTIIDQDLNFLLDYKKFKAIRQTLKPETIVLLRDRLNQMSGES